MPIRSSRMGESRDFCFARYSSLKSQKNVDNKRYGAIMSFTEKTRLDTGDTFPEMSFKSITGYSFELPSEFAGSWGVVLLYRGGW